MGELSQKLEGYSTANGDVKTYYLDTLKNHRLEDKDDFKTMIAFGLTNALFETRPLALEYEVADSTVERWGSGIARPHPSLGEYIRKSIVGFIDNGSFPK